MYAWVDGWIGGLMYDWVTPNFIFYLKYSKDLLVNNSLNIYNKMNYIPQIKVHIAKNHSTETAIVSILNDIFNTIDK